MGCKEILKDKLKSISFIKRIGQKINIYKSYFCDAVEFSNYYNEEAKINNDFKYSILLLVHSIEKGMCMSEPRPFGLAKVEELMKYLKIMEKDKNYCFEYELGLSILKSWLEFFKEHRWIDNLVYQKVEVFISERKESSIISGVKEYVGMTDDISEDYKKVIFSRHSVRDYKAEKLKKEDIEFAIECFIETPTACNRQMCNLIYISDKKIKSMLDKIIIGLPGFNKINTQYFIITYDLAAFAYSGERSQGLFNAGMCTTNFINGLHSKGIGSCCLQWSNKPSEDKKLRKALGLGKSEKIAVIIGCGYYKESNMIPCSVRKTKKDIFKVI